VFAAAWGGDAGERAIADVLAGRSLVLDVTHLFLALADVEDPRWRQYVHDSQNDPRDERVFLLTERDEVIGPLTNEQLTELGGDATNAFSAYSSNRGGRY